MAVQTRLTQAIHYCFLFLLFASPLIFLPFTYELFEFNKMIFVYIMTTIISGLWVLDSVLAGQFVIRPTKLALAIIVYLVVTLVTTIVSIDPHTSMFGYYSRFHGGFLSILCYTVLYFAFTTYCFDKAFIKRALMSVCAATFLVASFALLERLGIDKDYWVQDVQARVFSTLGQPNWLAGYLAMVIPINVVLFCLAKTRRESVIHFGLLTVNYLAFTFTYSRGGSIGLVVALAILTAYLLKHHLFTRLRLFCFGGLLIVTFVLFGNGLVRTGQFNGIINKISPPQATTASGTQLEVPGTESSKIRLIVWKGAWAIFVHNPLLGTGNETFAYAYYQYRDPSHNQTTEWDFLYNKAHNEYLNELATKGIVGFGAYAFLIGSFLVYAWHSYKTRESVPSAHQSDLVLAMGLVAGYSSYLLQNIFGFSVVSIALLFYLYPALVMGLHSQTKLKVIAVPFFTSALGRMGSSLILGIVFCMVLLGIKSLWWADVLYAQGYQGALSGAASEAYSGIAQAIAENPFEPLYQSQLGFIAAELAMSAHDQHRTELENELVSDAVAFTQAAIKTSPRNIPYLRTATKAYITLGSFREEYQALALYFAQKVVALSPTDPQDQLRLAKVYVLLNKPLEAQHALNQALSLKSDYQEAIAFKSSLASPSATPIEAP